MTGLDFYTNPSGTLDHYYGFGFDFPSFSSGNSFAFSIDPDIEGDEGYGAVVSELEGTGVKLFTTGGTITGFLTPDVEKTHLELHQSSAVPLPPTMMLFGPGLAFLASLRKRRASK